MFRTRLISGILLVIAALAVIFTGGVYLAAVLCLISIIAYRELTKACGLRCGPVFRRCGLGPGKPLF